MVTFQTLTVETGLPPDSEIEGVLVLDHLDRRAVDYLLDLQTSQRYPLRTAPDNSTYFNEWTWPAVSADRHWLAYKEWTEEPVIGHVRIVNAAAEL